MKWKVFISILILANLSLISFSQQKKIDVTYIANCGFLVETNNKQLVIDGLFKHVYLDYLAPHDSIVTKIIRGHEPFSKVHLMLITHIDKDHFNDSMVVEYLNSNPNNFLIAPSLAINAILKHADYKGNKNKIVELYKDNQYKKDTIIQGIRIQSFFLQHDNRPEIENVGYLIDMDGIKIFHTGDCTGVNTLQLEKLQLQNEDIDLAFLNYYGFWRDKNRRDFTTDKINPEKIVLMHIPIKEVEPVKESVNKINDFIDISIFNESMDKKSFVFDKY